MQTSQNKDFSEGKLYRIVNYIYWILLSGVLFILTNILFIFVLYVSLFALEGYILPLHIILITLVISTIPMGLSFTALYSVMRKVISEGEVSVVREFMKGYTSNFRQSILAWIIILLLGILFSVNYLIIIKMNYATFLIFPLFLLIALLICVTFYVFPLISHYYLSLKDIFRVSLYFSFKEFAKTFLILAIFVVAAFLFLQFPTLLFIILPGGLSFLVMLIVFSLFKTVQADEKEATSDTEGREAL